MTLHVKKLLTLCAAPYFIFSHPAVHAQTNQNSLTETVLITARKWQESDIHIPMTTLTVDSEALFSGLDSLDQYMSNIRVESSTVQNRVAIRGVSGYDTSLQDPVGYYLDGVALPMGGIQLPALFNIQRVEVIKGPQGALYGRNSEAGVINIYSLNPDWQPSIATNIQFGIADGADSYAPAKTASVRVSNTLVDNYLAGSLALRYEKNQGPFLNLADSDDEGGSLENLQLSSALEMQISPVSELYFRSYLAKNNRGKSQLRFSNGANTTERFVTNYDTDTFDNNTSYIHSLTFNYDMDDVRFVSVTGLTQFSRNFQADLDVTLAPIPPTLFDLTDDMVSQEVRFESTQNNDFRWMMGAYFYKQDTDVTFTIGGSQFLPRANRETNISQYGLAGFGQAEFLMTQKWRLTLGARIERINKDGQQAYSSPDVLSYSDELHRSVLLPSVSLAYNINTNSTVYGSVSKGYLPGGFNYASAQNVASFSYGLETSQNAELGYKSSFFEQHMSFNVAAFYIKNKSKQIVDLLPGFIQSISNAAKTKSYGLELSSRYTNQAGVLFYAQLGLNKAQAKEYETHTFQNFTLVTTSLAGNTLPLAPELTYGVGIKYDQGHGFFSNLNINGSSKYYFDVANSLSQPSNNRVNGELGYHFEHYSVSFIVQNAFDEEIISRAVQTNLGSVVEDTAPRYIGFKLAMEW